MSRQNNKYIPKVLSFWDLKKHNVDIEVGQSEDDTTKNIIVKFTWREQELTEAQVRDVLWSMGINSKDYTYIIQSPSLHRTANNSLRYDYRFEGPERLDIEWIQSNKASDEAHLASCCMGDIFAVARALKSGNLKNY